MGVIIEGKRRNYYGLDADKALIPVLALSVSDTFFATDTKLSYIWDGSAWILVTGAPVKCKVGDFVQDLALPNNSRSITGVGFTPKFVLLFGVVHNTNVVCLGFGTIDATGGHAYIPDLATWGTGIPYLLYPTVSSTDYVVINLVSMDVDGFTFSWGKGGSPSGDLQIMFLAIG